jgi:hypothetical protein
MTNRRPRKKKHARNNGFLVEKANTRAPTAQISFGVGCNL